MGVWDLRGVFLGRSWELFSGTETMENNGRFMESWLFQKQGTAMRSIILRMLEKAMVMHSTPCPLAK